jgi:hypothetical protein
MPITPTPTANAKSAMATAPDPNVFAASFLAGCMANGVAPDSYDSHLRNAWRAHRKFVEWVMCGGDIDYFEAMDGKQREMTAREAAVERADREAAEAKKRANAEAFGKRESAITTSA